MSDKIAAAARRWEPEFPAPEGYVAWHEWAGRQFKMGLRQAWCGLCSKYRFPVEMSERTISGTERTIRRDGAIVDVPWTAPVCRYCEAKQSQEAPEGGK